MAQSEKARRVGRGGKPVDEGFLDKIDIKFACAVLLWAIGEVRTGSPWHDLPGRFGPDTTA